VDRPLRIGLTGGIASGKSEAARLFAARGVPVIDTDVIAREIVEPGQPALDEIVATFGSAVLDADGRLDRRALRRKVFANPEARLRLERIMHPAILRELERRAAEAGGPYQVFVIPLLVEGGRTDRVDRVLVVDCPEALQLARLAARDGETDRGARAILAAQASRADRLAAADDVIVNDGTLAQLASEVARLDADYRELARRRG